MPRRPRPPLTEADVKRHHSIMGRSPPASAHDHLRTSFSEAGYELRSLTGLIEGVAVWDQNNRYLFAWQVNPHHLLFYLRRPALGVDGELHTMAVTHHPRERVTVNTSEETKISLQSLGDAKTLTGWLFPKLPLPVIPRRRARTGA